VALLAVGAAALTFTAVESFPASADVGSWTPGPSPTATCAEHTPCGDFFQGGDDSAVDTENTALVYPVMQNDCHSTLAGQTVTWFPMTPYANVGGTLYAVGTATGNSAGSITFTPPTGFVGTVDIGYDWTETGPEIDPTTGNTFTNTRHNDGAHLRITVGTGNLTPAAMAAYPVVGVGPTEDAGGSNQSELCECQLGFGGDPVDTSTGDFSHSFTDPTIPGRGPAISVNRSYSSADAANDSLFGYGWSSLYGMSLTADSTTAAVTVHQENGSTVAFAVTSSAALAPVQPRELATLTYNPDGTYTFIRRKTQIFTFNGSGQLIGVSDLNGNKTTLAYDGSGYLASITDVAGRTVSVTTSAGHVTKMTDPDSHSYTYAYDGSGNLTSVTDPTNAVWAFTYDSNHRLLTMLDPNQHSAGTPVPLTNTYDSSGRVTSQSDFAGRTTTFDYTSISGATKTTDPVGDVTVDYYSNGLRTKETTAYGTAAAASTTFTYDSTTEGVASVTDPLGHSTSYTYDSDGNTLTTTDALSRTTTSTFNSLDEPLTVKDPIGTTTTNTYDSNGNELTTATPLIVGGSTVATKTTTHHHGDSTHPGDVTSVTDPDGNTTTNTYDAYGDLTSTTAPPTPENSAGDKTTYTYDTNTGWLTSKVDPKGNVSGGTPANYTTTYGYDADGRRLYTRDAMWSSSSPSLHESSSTYDGDGNVTSTTDPDGKTTTFAYDADNELKTTTQADSTTLTKTWSADGMVLTSTDAAAHTTTYTYDARNDLVSTQTPGGKTTTNTYDLAGNLTLQAAPGASCTGSPTAGCTSFTYDNANEVTARTYLDGVTHSVTSISYDGDGRRTGQTDATGSSTSTYDTLGRLTSSTNGHGVTTSYTYDLNGNVLTTTYPGTSHTVTKTYDALNRLASVSDWNSNTTTYAYDANSNPVTTTLPSSTGETDTTAYNQLDQITSITDSKSSTTLAGFTYTRDSAGQLLTSTTTGISEPNQTYTYNNLEQLTASGSSSSPTSYGYTAGNDISNRGTTSGGAASTLTYNSDDQPCWSSPATVTGATCVTIPANATTFSYSNSGDRAQAASLLVDAQVSAENTGTGGSVTTGSFSTAHSGDLLLAFISNDGPSGSTQTSSISGGGLTWSLVSRSNAQAGDVDIFQARAGGTLSGVTVTGTAAITGYHQSIMVLAYTGAAGVGAHVHTSNTTSNPFGSLTTTANGSILVGAGLDEDHATARTLSSGQSMLHEYSDTGASRDFWVQETSNPVATSGTSAHISDSAPTTDHWELDVVEVIPAITGYSYDEAQNLSTYTPATGTATSYAYDGDGLRQSKTTGSTTTYFTWDGGRDLLSDGTNYYVYGQGSQPLEQIAVSSGAVTYLHHDQLGSTRLLTNTSGTTVGSASYDPYGIQTSVSGTVSLLGFAGQYTDPESGLIYMRARSYDPATAQFLTVDPLVSFTGDAYTYISDNPVNGTDPNGAVCLSAGCLWNDTKKGGKALASAGKTATKVIHAAASVATTAFGACAVIAGLSGVGDAGPAEACAALAGASSAVQVASGAILYATGNESGTDFGLDVASGLLGGAGYSLARLSSSLAGVADGLDAASESAGFFKSLAYAGASGFVEGASTGADLLNASISIPSVIFGAYLTTNELLADFCNGFN